MSELEVSLGYRVGYLLRMHGGIRAAARALGVDAAYLIRIRDGKKVNPSDTTLAKLGLKKKVIYELLDLPKSPVDS